MVSIIVPVYNVEQYLDECVSSIVNQTVTDLEIILVDDGSTDHSGALCDAWAQKDRRITVYHKSNGGLTSTWKYGVRRASGEYIASVDSDDWIDADMYEKMLASAEETGADLICASFVCENSDGSQAYQNPKLEPGFYDRNRILTDLSPYFFISKKYHDRGIAPSRVLKLFKRDLLMRVLEDCDERVSMGEDLVLTFSYLQIAQSLFIMDGFWPYHYRANDASITRAFSAVKYEKIDILHQVLLSVNEKYRSYDYSTQIYTDYLALYFRTVDNQMLAGADSNLIGSLRESFRAESIQKAIKMSDLSMLSRKHRLYLCLMRLGLARAVVMLRRIKDSMTR